MSATLEEDAKKLGMEIDQLETLLLKGETIKNGKNISKFHKKQYKRLINKIGFQTLMPRFNKTPKFWKIVTQEMVYFDFIQGDFEMPPFILDEMKNLFDIYYRYVPTVPVSGKKYSPFEIDQLALSFATAVNSSFSDESRVCKMCNPFNEIVRSKEVFDTYLEKIRLILGLITRRFSSLHSWNYVAEFEIPRRSRTHEMEMHFTVRINRKKAEIYTEKEKYQRNYYKLETSSIYLYNFITIFAQFEGDHYPVFIQRHALERIHERMGIDLKYVTDLLLTQVSFRDVRTYRGNLLIPLYSNYNHTYKMGYLLGNIRENRLLIDTFLFISQDGTPEGDKLNDLLKINKVEKNFLELDRVEHFINSNLRDDTELSPIFKTCNLSHLFNLYYREDKKRTITRNADFIKDMLQLDNTAIIENLTSAEDLKREFMLN